MYFTSWHLATAFTFFFFFHICSPTLVIFYLRNKQVIKHVCCTQKKKSGILNHTPFFFYCGRAKKSCFFPERNRRMQRRFPMSRQAAYGEEEIPPRLQSGTGARERQERDGTIHDRGIPLRKPCGLLLATQRWSLACGSSQQQPSCVSAMLFRRRPEELFDIHHSDASVIWRMR